MLLEEVRQRTVWILPFTGPGCSLLLFISIQYYLDYQLPSILAKNLQRWLTTDPCHTVYAMKQGFIIAVGLC